MTFLPCTDNLANIALPLPGRPGRSNLPSVMTLLTCSLPAALRYRSLLGIAVASAVEWVLLGLGASVDGFRLLYEVKRGSEVAHMLEAPRGETAFATAGQFCANTGVSD